MIDLRVISCAPVEVATDYQYVVGSETSCPDAWSGVYSAQAEHTRRHRLRWPTATRADLAAFQVAIVQSLGGSQKVVVSPPTDPAGESLSIPRSVQQTSIVGRLVPPFSITESGNQKIVLEATLEEDL